MNKDPLPQQALSVNIAKYLLIGLTSLFAWVSLVTYAAQVFKLSFVSYALLSILSCIGLLLLEVFYLIKIRKQQAYIVDVGNIIFLGIIALASAFFTIYIIKPDADDFLYLPNAVYHLANPTLPMDWTIHYLYTNGEPIGAFFANTATPYEYIQAVIAYLSSVQYLFIYYVVAAGLIGILIPVSYFYALSHFSDRTLYALLGTVMIIGSMLFLAETHRTIGSMSYTRAFQGKVLFLSAGIPLFIGMTRDHFKKPTLGTALILIATNIALIGISSTAIVFMPFLAILLALAEYFIKENFRSYAITVVSYLGTLIYNAGFALATLKYAETYLSTSSPLNQNFPSTFWGQISLLINPALPMTPILAAAASALALLLLPVPWRNYFGIWMIAAFVLFLNPISGTFLINYITTSNIYWRMFYLFPFPLTIGLSIMALFTRLHIQFNLKQWVIAGTLVAVWVTIPHFLFPGASAFSRRLGWAQYKLSPVDFKAAQLIADVTPPGVMLAPNNIDGMMTIIRPNYPQMRIQDDVLRSWLGEDAELRINASNFLGGDDSQIQAFQSTLTKYPAIESIVIKLPTWKNNENALSRVLESQGFTNQKVILKTYVVIWK